ncbi:pseudouridine synthase [Amniculicola lignicola CBS 123094]|uniref:tRNA pseudouridine(55) synthase n=1 Tax=Amniculicola lignicola CBS 123094 TaxID=1392246 RepID=A0A6A5WL68_9PLEO|nr:pseudouridine synthase [Amniculicola lignicola CBS 123094]
MASSPKETRKVIEGIIAINKPQWASSAGALRDLENKFARSSLFTPWLTHTRRHMMLSGSKRRHIDNLKVKLGHGGTLDPLATGVLIVGVGRGTKCLQRFLDCTKSYECVVLFGAATDSYDAVGKVVSRAPYEHVTKEKVEEALAEFRGKIMQKPSIFSALKVDGKKMYEYARAGGEVPEVKARPVEVLELEMVDWLEPGSHEFEWPKEEVDSTAQIGAQKLMGVKSVETEETPAETLERTEPNQEARGIKRLRSEEDSAAADATVTDIGSQLKKARTDDEPTMSGALPADSEVPASPPTPVAVEEVSTMETPATETPVKDPKTEPTPANPESTEPISTSPKPQPPAARLRMTVTSGFYVRSLCHDLGLALSSHGLMSSLVRSRQGDYTLGENVTEFSDFESGPEVWEPKVQASLESFMEKEGWTAEEVEDVEEWEESMEKRNWKEAEEGRKEKDRERSFQGGRKGGKGGGGNRNYYSKDMRGGKGNHRRDGRDGNNRNGGRSEKKGNS